MKQEDSETDKLKAAVRALEERIGRLRQIEQPCVCSGRNEGGERVIVLGGRIWKRLEMGRWLFSCDVVGAR